MNNRTIPFGYIMVNGQIIIDKSVASAVNGIFQQYIEGRSMLTIAERLNTAKIEYMPGVVGWNKARIKRIIENPKYAGEDDYPPIISKDTFEEIQKLRKSKSNQKNTDRSKVIYKIHTPVICPCCGAEMKRKSDVKRKRPQKWICQNKECRETIYITDEELLDKITCDINSIINNPDVIIINETDDEQDSRLTRIDNDICRKLDTFRFEKKQLRKELFDRFALGYQILNQDCYIAMLMRNEMKCTQKQTSFPLRLFNKYVREVHLGTNASVSIMLINNQIIRG